MDPCCPFWENYQFLAHNNHKQEQCVVPALTALTRQLSAGASRKDGHCCPALGSSPEVAMGKGSVASTWHPYVVSAGGLVCGVLLAQPPLGRLGGYSPCVTPGRKVKCRPSCLLATSLILLKSDSFKRQFPVLNFVFFWITTKS